MLRRSLFAWLPLLGSVLWLALAGVRLRAGADEATLAEVIVLFVPLVVVPLVLPLTVREYRSSSTCSKRHPIRAEILGGLGGLGGVGLVVGGLVPDLAGLAAIVLCLPWIGFCGLAALHGIGRLLARGRLSAAELAIDLGLLWLPGAALWLVVFRGELVLGGFGGLSALLTAAHFHAAGFGALVMVGLLGRGLAAAQVEWARRVFPWAAGALMLAFPLLAAGIGSGIRAIEVAGAGLYVVALPVVALLQVAAALRLRGRPIALRVLLAMSAVALVLATAFAGGFALQGFYGAAVPIMTMLRMHGLVNALGFLGLGILAWSRLRPAPLAGPGGIPFSRLRSPGRVGADFLAAYAPSSAPAPAGLVDALRVFDRPGFASAAIDPAVRAFYEETSRHALTVTPHWRFPFRVAGKIWHALGRRVGQLMLPLQRVAPQAMVSRIVAVAADVDGRPGVRGWVRQLGEGGPPVYVAAYATHSDPEGQVYMNIAFPLPRANMTSVLRLDHDGGRPGGLVLTTCAQGKDDRGDQGVYLATAIGALRLPVNETIWVWHDARGLWARHEMWAFGLCYLELDYAIEVVPG